MITKKTSNTKKIIVLILTVLQITSLSEWLTGQETSGGDGQMDAVPLVFEIKLSEKIVFGNEISLTIVLAANKEQEIYPLDIADIKFILRRVLDDDQKPREYEANIGGSTKIAQKTMPDGTIVTEWLSIKRKKNTLDGGGKVERVLDLSTVFHGRRFIPGNYTLSAVYENQTEAKKVAFKISVDKEETVPALINLIERGDMETKTWARNSLFAISGYPGWSPKEQDSPEEIKERVEELRVWWKENKTKIELKTDCF